MKKIEIEGYEGNDVGYMCVFCRLLLILGTVDAMTALPPAVTSSDNRIQTERTTHM
jgi:hypothetical protein